MKGTVALVTGGTGGIGRAAAIRFAQAGAKVAITGRRQSEGEETVRLIQKAGGEGLFIKADASIEKDARMMIDETLKRYGRLDFAFNNAGIEGKLGPVVEAQEEIFHSVINTNVWGVLVAMKYEIPAMRKGGGGAIVNNASIAGVIGMSGGSIYMASKHAVLGITKCAALEVAKENIRVNAVSPGAIETEMYERFTGRDQKMQETMRNLHPIGRTAKPEEIASTVIFLCSKDASFITGANLVVDGGYTVQ